MNGQLPCTFPGCEEPIVQAHVCIRHERVTIAANGSWVDAETAEDQ